MKDHCSFAPDKLFGYDISKCCQLHDEAYDLQEQSRVHVDYEFYMCLLEHSNKYIALVYYCFVRAFGWYNWKFCRNKP